MDAAKREMAPHDLQIIAVRFFQKRYQGRNPGTVWSLKVRVFYERDSGIFGATLMVVISHRGEVGNKRELGRFGRAQGRPRRLARRIFLL
jgi:hypothetical protein